jgi:hypothetical protein
MELEQDKVNNDFITKMNNYSSMFGCNGCRINYYSSIMSKDIELTEELNRVLVEQIIPTIRRNLALTGKADTFICPTKSKNPLLVGIAEIETLHSENEAEYYYKVGVSHRDLYYKPYEDNNFFSNYNILVRCGFKDNKFVSIDSYSIHKPVVKDIIYKIKESCEELNKEVKELEKEEEVIND